MNPVVEALDLRNLHLPISELEPVTHAIADAASGAADTNYISPTLPPNISPSSTQSVSTRLALLIRHALHPTASQSAPSTPPFVQDVFTKPTPSVLTRELALVQALAIWSDSILSQRAARAIYRPLAEHIISTLHQYLLRPHLTIPPTSLRLWQDADYARRHIFHSALAMRYNGIHAAPTAAMIAGTPLVLYIYQDAHVEDRHPDSPVCDAWERVVRGTALFQRQAVSSVDTVRATVALTLKSAVKERSLSPALVVVDATLNDTFCAAAMVLRALCDSYGVCLHVEGDALSLLLAGNTTSNLTYDVADFIRSSHSAVLDVASWFGRYRTAVVSVSVSETASLAATSLEDGKQENSELCLIADFELSRVMSLWFLLQRLHVSRCADIMRSLCDMSLVLTDALLAIPHLIECKSSGCGANVFISYASVNADAASRAAVNRAMLAYFERKHEAMRNLLGITNYENREWLSFSPARILRAGIDRPCSIRDIMLVCSDLIYAARRCEVVANGRAAFTSRIRQSQDLEIGNLPLEDAPHSPLFFSALRVTPFGEVSLNGYWVKDQEMTERVEKFTYALASLFEAQRFESFEGMLYDSDSITTVPVVCIGPLLADMQTSENGVLEDVSSESITEPSNSPGLALSARSAVLAEQWDIGELASQDMALKAADNVLAVLDMTLNPSPELPAEYTEAETSTGILTEVGNNVEELKEKVTTPQATGAENSLSSPHVLTEHVPMAEASTERIPVVEMTAIETEKDSHGSGKQSHEDEDTVSPSSENRTEESPVKRTDDRQPQSSGLWSLIFGERNANMHDQNEEDTGSSTGSAIVEDDYFRV